MDICHKKKYILESSKQPTKDQRETDKYWVSKCQYTLAPRMMIDGYRALGNQFINQFNAISKKSQELYKLYPVEAALSFGMLIGIVSAWITSLYTNTSQKLDLYSTKF